jgi:hypothetical protein
MARVKEGQGKLTSQMDLLMILMSFFLCPFLPLKSYPGPIISCLLSEGGGLADNK